MAKVCRVSLGVIKCSKPECGDDWLYRSMNILKTFQLYILKWGKYMLYK